MQVQILFHSPAGSLVLCGPYRQEQAGPGGISAGFVMKLLMPLPPWLIFSFALHQGAPDPKSPRDMLLEAVALGNSNSVKAILDLQGHMLKTPAPGEKNPLHRAIMLNEPGIVRMLLEHGAPVQEPDSSGATPLHMAVFDNNPAMVELLLAHGADIEATDRYGATALILAAREGHADTADILLKHNASVKAQDSEVQATPLHWAVLGEHREMARLLISRGAEVNAKDGSGRRPLRLASDMGSEKMIQLLKKYRARK